MFTVQDLERTSLERGRTEETGSPVGGWVDLSGPGGTVGTETGSTRGPGSLQWEVIEEFGLWRL